MHTCKPNKLKIAITIGILGSSLIPIPVGQSHKAQVIQNLMHIPAFAIMSMVLLQLFKNCRLCGWPWLIFSLSVLVFVGITAEVVQTFIPSRWPSIQDVFLNVVGISLGTTLFLLLDRFKLPVSLKRDFSETVPPRRGLDCRELS